MESYYDEKIRRMDRGMRLTAQISQPYLREEYLATAIGKIELLKPMSFKEKLKRSFFKSNTVETPKEIVKEVPMEPIETIEPATNYLNTYSSFSGADCVISIDGKVTGEVQSIEWYKPTEFEVSQLVYSDFYDKTLAIKYPIVIKMSLALFSSTEIKDLKDAEIKIDFCNEYGAKMSRTINGVCTLRECSGIDVDSILLDTNLILIATSMTDYVSVKEV